MTTNRPVRWTGKVFPWLDQGFYRCITPGCPRYLKLLSYRKISEGVCHGHKVTPARHSTLFEDLKMILGMI